MKHSSRQTMIAGLIGCLASLASARPTNDFNVQIPSTDNFTMSQITLPVGNVSNIIVFGDSLSDNGNVFTESNGTYPPAPYFNGRWSNGPTWVEYVANATNASLYNYAFGGSAACSNITQNGVERPNLATQIEMFRNNSNSSSLNTSSDLYVVWIGANDYFDAATNPGQIFGGFPPKVVECIKNGINTILSDFSPKRLLVLDLPPLGQTPIAKNYSFAAEWFGSEITSWHNNELYSAVKSLEKSNSNTTFTLVKTPSIFANVTSNAQTYNLTDTSDACYVANSTGVCSDPNSYLFWDQVHPTTHSHKILASLITEFNPQWDALQSGAQTSDANNIQNWFNSNGTTGVQSWIAAQQGSSYNKSQSLTQWVGQQQQRVANGTGSLGTLFKNGTNNVLNGTAKWFQSQGQKVNNGSNTAKNWLQGGASNANQNAKNATQSIKNFFNGA